MQLRSRDLPAAAALLPSARNKILLSRDKAVPEKGLGDEKARREGPAGREGRRGEIRGRGERSERRAGKNGSRSDRAAFCKTNEDSFANNYLPDGLKEIMRSRAAPKAMNLSWCPWGRCRECFVLCSFVCPFFRLRRLHTIAHALCTTPRYLFQIN